MAYPATGNSVGGSLVSGQGREANDQEFIINYLLEFNVDAWLLIEDGDFPTLQNAANDFASCARALGYGFIADMVGLMAVSAAEGDVERCHLFLAVIKRESDFLLARW